ncbi:PREDICTED: uncharacterized protein LOC103335580 [Prunus mume]|uniref:Uncharacterized protein LOC103335580 n=1 Tax=Prunus mume TaxID=102107 RepID=A0ABM0PAP0_PRUMU|nr:PREDICTED: uncharacterized protein LOC103335580 [Prunus mume]
MNGNEWVQVKKLVDEHDCGTVDHNFHANSTWARQKATSISEGTFEKQYELLWDYAAKLRRTNVGSTVIIKCELEGERPRQLLYAVGVDPNNDMYPIVYVVDEVENYETWSWFCQLLAEDLGIENSSGYVFITDKQKGLIDVVHDHFPNAEHRHCLKNLEANFCLLVTEDWIPCKHACAVIGQLNGDHIAYVDACYKKEAFMRAYSPMVHPMTSEDLWPKCHRPPLLPPLYHKQPGRPRKKRMRSAEDKEEDPDFVDSAYEQSENECELLRKDDKAFENYVDQPEVVEDPNAPMDEDQESTDVAKSDVESLDSSSYDEDDGNQKKNEEEIA